MEELLIYDFAEDDGFALIESETTVPGIAQLSFRREAARHFLWLDFVPDRPDAGDTEQEREIASARIVIRLPPKAIHGSIMALILDVLAAHGKFTAGVQVVLPGGAAHTLTFKAAGPSCMRILQCLQDDLPPDPGPIELHRLIIEPHDPHAPFALGLQRLSAVGELRAVAAGLAETNKSP